MAVPYTFGTATAAIPLSQLDTNFATAITLGNTAVYLGNTTTSIGNLTLTNVTISSGEVTSGNVSVSGNVTLSGGTANGVAYLNGSKVLTTGSALTFDGTALASSGSGTQSLTVTSTATAAYLQTTGANTVNARLQSNSTTASVGTISNHNFLIQTNATTVGTFDTSGNLGLGVTPSANAGVSTLNIANYNRTFSALTLGSNANSAGYVGYNMGNTSTSNTWKYISADTGSALYFAGNEYRFMQFASGSAGATTSGTQAMTLDAGGRLLLNRTTNNNNEILQISGNANALCSAFFANTTTGQSYGSYIAAGTNSTDYALRIQNAAANTDYLKVTGDGNLGIGTTSPTGGANRVVDVYGSGSSAINFHNATSGTTATDGGVIGQYGSDLVLYNYEAGIIQFGTSNTERARIDSSGNLLVGLTSVPANAVSAAGAASFGSSVAAIGYNSRSGVSGSYTNNRMNLYWNGSNARLYVDNTDLGQIAYVSDYRLKENIETQTVSAIERVNALRPVTFNFKKVGIFEGSSNAQEGFIAHEVQQVIASAVNGDKDAVNSDGEIQPQNLNWMPIVSVLVKAIQEQQALIIQLQADVAALKGA